jgi:Cof subfamily protein (haloacid dehalogenase superfamily)
MLDVLVARAPVPSLARAPPSSLRPARPRVPRCVSSCCLHAAPGSLRLVAVDMDGTLLRPDGALSEETVATLRRVHDLGAIVCVASGRPAPTLRRYVRQLDIGSVAAVCYNGACATLLDGESPNGDVVWHTEYLDRDAVARVLDLAAELDLPVQYCLPDGSYAAPSNDRQRSLLDCFDALVGPEGHSERVASLHPLDNSGEEGYTWPYPAPLKLVVVCGSQSEADDVAVRARALLPAGMFHVIAAEQHVEFLSPGTNKASGLRRACEALGMTMEETVAFGDADNDAEMLAACGLSFAMPGSRPKAIEAADRMCEFDNSNEGVAVELRALIDEGCIGTSRSVEKKASMSMR